MWPFLKLFDKQKPPPGFPIREPLSDAQVIRLYCEHRALVALLYEHGGTVRIWPSTLAHLREHDVVVVESEDDHVLTIRLAVPSPRVPAEWRRP